MKKKRNPLRCKIIKFFSASKKISRVCVILCIAFIKGNILVKMYLLYTLLIYFHKNTLSKCVTFPLSFILSPQQVQQYNYEILHYITKIKGKETKKRKGELPHRSFS